MDKSVLKPVLKLRRTGRFFIVGFIALMLMVPLAATSFNAAIRYMGLERWQLLRRLVYLLGILGRTLLAARGRPSPGLR